MSWGETLGAFPRRSVKPPSQPRPSKKPRQRADQRVQHRSAAAAHLIDCYHPPLLSCQVAGAQSVQARTEPRVTTDVVQAGWALTTVLTTTSPDNLPRYAILQIESCQVSHGMPQCARSLQAGGLSSQTQRRSRASLPRHRVRRCVRERMRTPEATSGG
jgi:hypothetical protein